MSEESFQAAEGADEFCVGKWACAWMLLKKSGSSEISESSIFKQIKRMKVERER